MGEWKPQSSIVLVIPEAEPFVGSWRALHDWTAAEGAPAHITLMGGTGVDTPPVAELDSMLDVLAQVAMDHARFDCSLLRVARFDGATVLIPDNTSALQRLSDDVSRLCGVAPRASFHMTVARGDDETLATVERDVSASLPIRARAREVVLIGRPAAGGGVFEPLVRWPLGGA